MARRQLSHRNKGSTTLGSTRTWLTGQGLASASLAVIAFGCYYATLLPGLDLGDSASFQTGVGSLTLRPRQAYPLYYALGNLFVWLHPGEPARALNLASAIYGAFAAGLAALVAARLAQSLVAGIAAGSFLAFSYTFWTQAVTAEVYTLHLLMAGAALLSLLAWADRPTLPRLAWFYTIYAVGFGNHLSMVLLLPAFGVFLLTHRRPGPADPLRPGIMALAVAITALGALQYAWNFRGLWAALEPPTSLADAVGAFWFDVTKADWRETLVMNVSDSGLQSRPEMYWFDLRQQFGVPGVILAVAGLGYLGVRWPSRGLLLLLLFAGNLAFAWTYNVGDAYIFFLPAHYIVALCAGAGVAATAALLSRLANLRLATAASLFLVAYPAWRGYDTFPAVDRSRDNRAMELLDTFTTARAEAVFGVDSNWQVQNAFEYFMREHRPGVPWFSTDEIEWLGWKGSRERFNEFVVTNTNAGRELIVTARAHERVRGRPTSRSPHDPPPEMLFFSESVKSAGRGTPYVFALLRPDREYPLNTLDLARAWGLLATGTALPPVRQYTVVAGRVGDRPALIESQDRPYRVKVRLEPFDVEIRMESWLPTDTIRRAGFGHVIVNRRHELTLERGLSFIPLATGARPAYASGLFAPLSQVTVRPEP
jgi:hypothetical protein